MRRADAAARTINAATARVGGADGVFLTGKNVFITAESNQQSLADERVQAAIQGKQVRKVIVVPRKLVNLVVTLR